MFGVIIWLIVIGVIILGIMEIKDNIIMEKEEKRRQEERRQGKIREWKEKYQKEIVSFENDIRKYYSKHEYETRETIYMYLTSHIENMRKYNNNLPVEERFSESEIKKYEDIAEKFNLFGAKMSGMFPSLMMNTNSYGEIQDEYLKYIKSLRKEDVDSKIEYIEHILEEGEYEKIWKIDLKEIFDSIWFYALHKPYLKADFEKTKEIFYRISKGESRDILLAEMYAIQQMGAGTVLRNRITELFKNRGWSSHDLTSFASGLMWMKAYNEEKMVLQEMLSRQMDMPAKLQERLHALSNGGENAPSDYDVRSSKTQIYLDTASLAWNDSEYNNFFENLSFKEKVLTYSLAIRDENKDLFITQAMNLPDNIKICNKLMTVFQEEYGSQVVARNVEGIALSGSGSEKIPGILVRTKECKQLGIFLHIARIGKKLNIKFYTLFIPITNDIGEQRQQVISLYKKLSPTVTMWENSLKDTILMAIQQLLNVAPKPEPQPNYPVEDEPVEF